MLKVRWLAPWFLALLIAFGAVAVMAPAAGAQPTQTPAVSPADALRQLAVVRQSIDRTLTLIKDGRSTTIGIVIE